MELEADLMSVVVPLKEQTVVLHVEFSILGKLVMNDGVQHLVVVVLLLYPLMVVEY